MRSRLWSLLVLLASTAAAQPSGSWENVSFGPEGPAVGGSLISAMAAAPNGDVFASGYFSSIGGVLANQIARWDGAQWHALGNGLSGYASDLATGPDGALYAAGASAAGVVRWDGQAWTALGDLSSLPFVRVDDVAVGPDGTVYAGINTYIPRDDNGYYEGRVKPILIGGSYEYLLIFSL